MLKNIIFLSIKNEKGSALLLVMMMLSVLLGAAGWLGMQARTETTIVSAVKDYAKSFNAADGSLQISLYYLRKIANPTNGGRSWDPKKSGGSKVSITSAYDSFINNDQMQLLDSTSDNIESMAQIILLNYSSLPPAGWGLSDKGYGNKFTAYQYKAVGKGTLKFNLADGTDIDKASSQVSALLLRMGT
jgi:hypothetical protein